MGFASKLKKKVFGGSGAGVKQAATLTPEQAALLKQQTQLAQQYTPGIYAQMNQMALNPENTYNRSQADIESFYQDTMANPAMYAFQNELVPQLSEQYGGKFHSAAKTKTLGRAFSDLQNQLSQQRGNLFYNELLQSQQGQENALARQMQALSGMGGMMQGSLGTKAFENMYSQGGQGLIGQINQAMTPALMGSVIAKNLGFSMSGNKPQES
jgi:hypothetical protein